ncbi:DUF402 domain-containing protein [Bacillus sp. SD088]|uniref:DUF402 domain-containing protein n=1 Tax=Bacillus sp. SD088 TaxID=2782012 RepID=UPI001A96F700|nr:DUF402 domain-containing protein [Bacillus sp. SD088]MBO0993960.1 DUF402 domain-containing protein [Bacillus sp. SD088]
MFVHTIKPSIIERKIRYDATIVEYPCSLLYADKKQAILFHKVQQSFSMVTEQATLTIPVESYTLAYYWKDRPYNLYIWRDKNGHYLGAYFNIVKNTSITDSLITFEDLIIDVLVFPNGDWYILDEDELPVALAQFENGYVRQSVDLLTNGLDDLLLPILTEGETKFGHKSLFTLLNG